MTRQVIVTGAAGFIGSHVCERLLQDGWDVVGIDNLDPFYDPQIKESNLAAFADHPRFRLVRGDLNDPSATRRLLDEASSARAIVHLAAKAGVRPSVAAPADYVRANVDATAVVLDLARTLEAPLVFGSSSSVYGNTAQAPFSEDERRLLPISPYAGTKLAAEVLCGTWARTFGLRCVSLRFFTVIGERQRPDLALHAFTDAISHGRPVPVHGDGSMRRDFTYVADVVEGVTASVAFAGSLARGSHEIINLGGHATTSVLELIRLIEDALETEATLEHRPAPVGDVRLTYADIGKAARLLGYAPRVAVGEGVSRFVAWYHLVRAAAR